MKIRRGFKVVAALVLFSLLMAALAGCGSADKKNQSSSNSGSASSSGSSGGGGGDGAKKLKVAFVAEGTVNDGGWTASALEGLNEIKKKLGAETAYSDQVSVAQQEQVIRTYAKNGYDLIYGHGFQYNEVFKKVAADYPNTTFIVVNGNVTGPNLDSTNFRFGELGYFTGLTAGYMTKSNTVGVIGTVEAPAVVADVDTFKQGVLKANPRAQVQVTYVGSWDDLQKGTEAAKALLSKGADVLLNLGNAFSVGVFGAAKEKRAYTIGWVTDQMSMSPETVLTSGMQDVPTLYVKLAMLKKDGKLEGKVYNFGMKDGAQALAPFNDKLVPKDVQEKVNAAIKDYKDGKLQLDLKF
ncbi:MAG: BMP family protein [Firmicutes bacterium]|nr:BMP family protein [Bacillota bacterium]